MALTTIIDPSVATSRRRHYRLLWSGIGLANLFLIGLVVAVVVQNRQRAFDEAMAIAQNYSRTVEANFVGFVRRIDVTLLTVADEVARQRANGGIKELELNAFLARQDTHIAEARGLRVMDAQGNIRYAVSGVNIRGANIGDRPYFIRVRDDANAGLVFSEPLMGRASNMPVVTLSRRINDRDGSFSGEVNVAVATDRFTHMLSLLDLGPRGTACLWDKTHLIARYAKNDTAGARIGTPIPPLQLRSLIDSGEKASWYHAVTRLDSIERIVQFRQIGDYPLYIVIGLADADFLAEWRKDSLRLAGLAMVFAASTVLFALVLHRGLRRREEMEAALLVEETKFRSLFENANDGIFLQDSKGFVDCNRRGAQMYGLTREQIIGRSPASLCPERQPDGRLSSDVAAEKIEAALNGKPQYFEWQPMRADGMVFDVGITLNRIDLAGKTLLQSIVRDISERQQADEAIRTLNRELEARVGERTSQLEVANKELEDFSYSMSHDMRTPLRALDGFSKILLDEHSAGLDDEGRRLLTVLRDNARRIGRLIDDILRFLDLGRRRVEYGTVDIARLASEIFAELQAAAPARLMSLKIGALEPVWGDNNLLRQAMRELLANAVKFSPTDSEAVIELGAVAGELEDTYSVADRGIGFDMRYADKLFQVFERVHPTGLYDGSGIGLAIVKRIVGRHGGRVWAESRVGEGATFRFTLPHKKA
ncbi:MAG: ATP-binding protein [Sterolibacterium sp.]